MSGLSGTQLLVARFDALGDGDLLIGLCNDGSVQARLPTAAVRADHTVNSFTGYGDSADEAIADLWRQVEALPAGDSILVKSGTPDRAEYRWNGGAWKRGDYHEHTPLALAGEAA